MLVYVNYLNRSGYSKMQNAYRRLLAPARIKTRHNAQWPSTLSPDKSKFTIDVHRSGDLMLQFLNKAARLYAWKWPQLPDDPCFFNAGACWFLVSGHESFAYMSNTRENRLFMRSLGIDCEITNELGQPFVEKYTYVAH